MKDNIRGLTMGHAIKNFTDRVYTHPMMEELQQEMGKIKKWYPYGITPEFKVEEDE